jgi:hypothetical protein
MATLHGVVWYFVCFTMAPGVPLALGVIVGFLLWPRNC